MTCFWSAFCRRMMMAGACSGRVIPEAFSNSRLLCIIYCSKFNWRTLLLGFSTCSTNRQVSMYPKSWDNLTLWSNKCLVPRNQKLCWGMDFQKAWALRQGLSLENLAEFQCKPGFRDLLYVCWAQRDSLSCKFMPSLGGTESYWFPCALWRDQTSSACDLSAPH